MDTKETSRDFDCELPADFSQKSRTEYAASCRANLTERHNYVRQVATSFVVWFTFFCTLNYLCMGGFFSSLGWTNAAPNAHATMKELLKLVGISFVIQNTLSVAACIFLGRYFGNSVKQIKELEKQSEELLTYPKKVDEHKLRVPDPIFRIYTKMLLLMGVSCALHAAVWVGVMLTF